MLKIQVPLMLFGKEKKPQVWLNDAMLSCSYSCQGEKKKWENQTGTSSIRVNAKGWDGSVSGEFLFLSLSLYLPIFLLLLYSLMLRSLAV